MQEFLTPIHENHNHFLNIFIPIIACIWTTGHLITEQTQLLTQYVFWVISQATKNDTLESETKQK